MMNQSTTVQFFLSRFEDSDQPFFLRFEIDSRRPHQAHGKSHVHQPLRQDQEAAGGRGGRPTTCLQVSRSAFKGCRGWTRLSEGVIFRVCFITRTLSRQAHLPHDTRKYQVAASVSPGLRSSRVHASYERLDCRSSGQRLHACTNQQIFYFRNPSRQADRSGRSFRAARRRDFSIVYHPASPSPPIKMPQVSSSRVEKNGMSLVVW